MVSNFYSSALRFALLICANLLIFSLSAQMSLSHQMAWGGSQFDDVAAGAKSKLEGIFVCGSTQSANFPGKNQNHGNAWVAKMNAQNKVEWQIFPDGQVKNICATDDGGFAIVGTTTATDLEKNLATKHFGGAEMWIAKHDGKGELLWQHTLGSRDDDLFFSVQPTPDGGLVAAGEIFTKTFGNNSLDLMVVKFDFLGQKEWKKVLGGTNSETGGHALAVDAQGNIYLAASTQSSDKNIGASNVLHGGLDAYLVKISAVGKVMW